MANGRIVEFLPGMDFGVGVDSLSGTRRGVGVVDSIDVDLEVLHLREVEQDSPVGGAVTGGAVAAAHGELQPARARARRRARRRLRRLSGR